MASNHSQFDVESRTASRVIFMSFPSVDDAISTFLLNKGCEGNGSVHTVFSNLPGLSFLSAAHSPLVLSCAWWAIECMKKKAIWTLTHLETGFFDPEAETVQRTLNATMPQTFHHKITRGHLSLPQLLLRWKGMRDQVSEDRLRNCFVAIKDA